MDEQSDTAQAVFNSVKIMDNKLGILGTVTSPLLAVLGFLSDHAKELQALSFLASIIIAALTIPWWIRKWWREIFSDENTGSKGD